MCVKQRIIDTYESSGKKQSARMKLSKGQLFLREGKNWERREEKKRNKAELVIGFSATQFPTLLTSEQMRARLTV